MASQLDPSKFTINVPHSTMRLALTAPRESDGLAVVAAFNDPRVYLNLNSPPFPYTEKDWAERYAEISINSEQNLANLQVIREQHRTLRASQDWSKREWLGQTKWTSTIREVADAETSPYNGKFAGEIGVQRESFIYIHDADERQRVKDENDGLEPGDPRIIWMIGYWLMPEYHGRGIMTVVLRCLMYEVMIPYMNAHTIHGGYLEHNPASRRVFEKCGWSFDRFVPNAATIPATKLNAPEDRKVGLGLLSWTREPSN